MDGSECSRPDALLERRKQDRIERAKHAILDLFGEGCQKDENEPVDEQNIEAMNFVVELLANKKMINFSAELQNGTKAKIAMSANGFIKVERIETKKNKVEV